MSYPSLLIEKIEGPLDDFHPIIDMKKMTVKNLRVICKENGSVQSGRKADVIARLKKKGLLVNRGPRWFWFDEAFGIGGHHLFFVCICGHVMPMTRFNIHKSGTLYPSICCSNRKCGFHIWGKLDKVDEKDRENSRAEYEEPPYRKYIHCEDSRFSRMYYK